MASCSVKQGFLLLHECGGDAQFNCASCAAPICAGHAAMRPQAGGWLCPACAHEADAQNGEAEHGDPDAATAGAGSGTFSAGMGFAASDHLGFTSGRAREPDAGSATFDDS
ncbi:MAG: hypothetical protein JNJ60_10120 [Rhodocyclaceae bacterium]|nr:hypothetical protein [Rhodocyclaceae bacterium]